MARMRVLNIDAAAIECAKTILAYAEKNPYRPGQGGIAPGHDPNLVAIFNEIRVAFSFTHLEGDVFRHVSISVPEAGQYPNPMIALAIADLFGFTGWDHTAEIPEGWTGGVNQDEGCVVFIQKIEEPVTLQ